MVAEEDKGITFRAFSNILLEEQISEVYPDTPNAGDSSLGTHVKGSPDITHALQAYKIPKPPPYGGGVLDNIEIFLYGTGITQGKSSQPPKMVAYKVDDPSSLASTVSTTNVFSTGDITVKSKDIVVGTTHIEDFFPSIYCDYFTGNQEGWASEELTITNQRVSKFKGDGGLYITPEDAYEIGYTRLPYYHPHQQRNYPGIKYKVSKKASIKKMRMKHGTGYPGHPSPYTDVDADGNLKKSENRLIKLANYTSDGIYKTAINLPGGLSQMVYFKESDIKGKLVDVQPVVLSDAEKYGDEVNTDNTIFSSVRGCGEFFTATAPETSGEDGTLVHTVEKTGVVRFIAENVVSKGKCAQLYTFADTNVDTHPDKPAKLTSSGIDCIVDAVTVVGPLPMPCGPIPGPPGAFDSEWGHPSTDNDSYNYGCYDNGTIDITFTIPSMSSSAWYTHDSDGYVDMFRRSICIIFSNRRPDISTERCADFWNNQNGEGAIAGIILIKDPPDSDKSGIWAFDMKRFGNDGVGPTDHYSDISSWGGEYSSTGTSKLSDVDGSQIGPLVEGETYTLTVSAPVANDTSTNMIATIRTQPTGGAPRGTLVGDEDLDYHNLAIGRIDKTGASNTFAVVDKDTDRLAGDSISSGREVFRFMSIWNNNTKNQGGTTDWDNHAHADVTAVDINPSLDHDENVEIKMNIDSIRMGNFNLPMTNNTIIQSGKDGLVSMETSQSDIVIAGGNTRRMNPQLASSTFHSVASDNEQDHGAFTFTNSGDYTFTTFDKTQGAVPGYTIINIGTNTHSTLFSGSARYLFFNDFNCANLSALQSGTTGVMASNNDIYIGGGMYSGLLSDNGRDTSYALGFGGALNSCGNKASYYNTSMDTGIGGSGNNTEDHSITFASDTSVDTSDNFVAGSVIYLDGFGSTSDLGDVKGFRRQGLVKLALGAHDSLTPNAGRRENFFMSAKIIDYESMTGIATVDTTEPFKVNDDQDFIVYVMGGASDTNSMYNNTVRCLEIIDTNHVRLDWAGYATDGTTKLADVDIMPGLWISPYMYWISLRIFNWNDFEVGAFTEDLDAASDYCPYSAKQLPQKSYGSVLVTSDLGTPGSTFNESLYTVDGSTVVGAYENSWDLTPSTDSSILELSDFGFGSFVEADEESNQGFKGGYALEGSPSSDGWYTLKSRKGLFTKSAKLRPGDTIQFLLQAKDIGTDHQMSFFGGSPSTAISSIGSVSSGDEGYIKPKIVANYFDQLPQPLVNFHVKPDKTGLYPKLEWEPTQDTDLWFLQIHVDDEPIAHQYHKAILHLPLNESSQSGLFKTKMDNTDLIPKYYNYGARNVRAGVLLNQTIEQGGFYHTDNWANLYDVCIGTSYKWDGLGGNRVADLKSRRREWEEAVGVYDSFQYTKNINSGACLKIIPTSPIVRSLLTGTPPTDSTIDETTYNQYTKEPESQPPSNLTTTVSSKGSWTVDKSDIKDNQFTISCIVTASGYPAAEYELGTEANAAVPVTIVNNEGTAGAAQTLMDFADGSHGLTSTFNGCIKVSAVVKNSHSSSNISYPTGFRTVDSTATIENQVGDMLARIDSDSSNGGLTNSEYIRLSQGPGNVSGDDNNAIKFGNYGAASGGDPAGWSIGNAHGGQVGLYGTGSAAAGNGSGGKPTHGGKINMIPRSIIFRVGNFDTTNTESGANGYGKGKTLMGMQHEKLLCYLDSSGLINVWMKAKNQNRWLKIQSSKALLNDGVTPTHISVTFDKDLPRQNLKLYINGKLDAYTGDRATTGTETQLQDDADGQGGEPIDWAVGSDEDLIVEIMGRMTNHLWMGTTTAHHFGEVARDGLFGRIEEFVFLPYAIYYVNPQDASITIEKPFSDLRDIEYAEPKTHFAKVFIKDYHNIRGASADEVRQTNNVSWRKTAFKLNMS